MRGERAGGEMRASSRVCVAVREIGSYGYGEAGYGGRREASYGGGVEGDGFTTESDGGGLTDSNCGTTSNVRARTGQHEWQ